jgi:uncharacterized protein with HEPN domain
MPSERDEATLCDILRHIDLAEKFAREYGVEDYDDDPMPLYAIIRCLEVISEASRRLSGELKSRHPYIPWAEMAAAGNIYRHRYEDVLPQRVKKTLEDDLPPLRAAIDKELG